MLKGKGIIPSLISSSVHEKSSLVILMMFIKVLAKACDCNYS